MTPNVRVPTRQEVATRLDKDLSTAQRYALELVVGEITQSKTLPVVVTALKGCPPPVVAFVLDALKKSEWRVEEELAESGPNGMEKIKTGNYLLS